MVSSLLTLNLGLGVYHLTGRGVCKVVTRPIESDSDGLTVALHSEAAKAAAKKRVRTKACTFMLFWIMRNFQVVSTSDREPLLIRKLSRRHMSCRSFRKLDDFSLCTH